VRVGPGSRRRPIGVLGLARGDLRGTGREELRLGYSRGNLLEYTRSVDGVDADSLESCLDDRRSALEDEIDADSEQARSFGVRGTPTFAVFDPDSESVGTLVGAQPIERFDEAIERIKEA